MTTVLTNSPLMADFAPGDIGPAGPDLLSLADDPNFCAIGLNFTDHAAEVGMPLPKEPIIFAKAPNSICGPNDNVIIPKGSTKLDWEVELCIVIGKRAQYIKQQSDAKSYIAGYTICNDVSERSFRNGARARARKISARSARGW